jgi:hypothetical protein
VAYCSGAWSAVLEQISNSLDVLKKGFAAVPDPVVWGSMALVVIGIFITEFERNRAAREEALRERIERERAEREQAARQEMQSFVAWIAILSILAIIGAGICFYKISVYNNEARNEQVQSFNYGLNRSADRVVRAIGSHEEAVDRMSGAIKSHGGAIYNVGRAIEYHGMAVDNVGREVKYLGAAANRYTEQTTEYRNQRQKLLEARQVESRAAKWDRREKKVRIAATVGKVLVGGITGIQLGS